MGSLKKGRFGSVQAIRNRRAELPSDLNSTPLNPAQTLATSGSPLRDAVPALHLGRRAWGFGFEGQGV